MNDNLKKYRERLGFNQSEYAKCIDIQRSQLYKIEKNELNISASTIKKIKEYDPSADLEYILGYKESEEVIEVSDNVAAENVNTYIISSSEEKMKRYEEREEWYKNALEKAEERLDRAMKMVEELTKAYKNDDKEK